MSTLEKEDKSASTNQHDDDMDRLARQMLLEEAKRNKVRADVQGASGWQKPKLVTNRKFLRNTLISNAVHNIHKNEQERQQRSRSAMDRREQSSKHRRTRSRSPPPSRKQRDYDDDERSSKRVKKDK